MLRYDLNCIGNTRLVKANTMEMEKEHPPDEDPAMAHKNAGNRLFAAGDYAGARREYDAAIQVRPHVAAFHFNRGLCCCQMRDYSAAVPSLQTAISMDPDYGKAFLKLAEAEFHLGQWDQSRQHFRRAGVLMARAYPKVCFDYHQRRLTHLWQVMAQLLSEQLGTPPEGAGEPEGFAHDVENAHISTVLFRAADGARAPEDRLDPIPQSERATPRARSLILQAVRLILTLPTLVPI